MSYQIFYNPNVSENNTKTLRTTVPIISHQSVEYNLHRLFRQEKLRSGLGGKGEEAENEQSQSQKD